jgi:hypothetical protein
VVKIQADPIAVGRALGPPHIVKPSSARYPTIIFDEEYGLRAARTADLTAFDARIESCG